MVAIVENHMYIVLEHVQLNYGGNHRKSNV